VDAAGRGGSRDAEAGGELRVGVALVQVGEGEQGLRAGVEARQREPIVARWARINRAVKLRVRVESGRAA
jgi:hypothetical protein